MTYDDELPELTKEEREAMNSLPPDFIDRILRGERPIKRRQLHQQRDEHMKDTLNTAEDVLSARAAMDAATDELHAAGVHYDVARGVVVQFLLGKGIDARMAAVWAGQLLARLGRAGCLSIR